MSNQLKWRLKFAFRGTIMQGNEQLQSVVFFLSDHLCSAIEEGEKLFNLSYTSDKISPELSADDILDRLDDFHQFLDHIRTIEFMLLTKLNQARHWCIHLRHLDSEFKPVLDLFNTATSSLVDIESVLGIDEQGIFNGEGSHEHFIKSRQLTTEQTDEEGCPSRISVEDEFLLGGKVPLADILDACNSFLDSIDIRYDVMEDVPEEESEETDAAFIADETSDDLLEDQTKTA